MKTYILLLTTTLTGCMNTAVIAQEKPLLTLVNNMAMKGAAHLTLHLDGNIKVEYWDQAFVQVEIKIGGSNLPARQLRSLVGLGFFQMKMLGNTNGVALSMPAQALPVTVNGIRPACDLFFTIKVPHYTSVERYSETDGLLAMEPTKP